MQTPFALRRRADDLSKSKSPDSEKTTAKSRASRGPLLVIIIGGLLVFCHSFVEDYAQAIAAPDGLYIPDAQYTAPSIIPSIPSRSYSHNFRIYNARPWSVQVEANANCGCTSLSWEKNTIFPLAWREIQVRFTPRANPVVGQSVLVHVTNPKTKSVLVASVIK